MNNLSGMMLAMGAGLVLGGLYFGGLWLTLQRLPRSPRPALLMGGSYLLRLGVTLGGLYLVMGDSWERAAACMVGFTVVRIIMARRWRPTRDGDSGAGERQTIENDNGNEGRES